VTPWLGGDASPPNLFTMTGLSARLFPLNLFRAPRIRNSAGMLRKIGLICPLAAFQSPCRLIVCYLDRGSDVIDSEAFGQKDTINL
jgi:hypothetical protein